MRKHEKSLLKRAGFIHNQLAVSTVRKLALRNSTYGAGTSASTAVNASVSVDNVLAVALSDSAYGALASARTAGNASRRNYVCHCVAPPNNIYIIIVSQKIQNSRDLSNVSRG